MLKFMRAPFWNGLVEYSQIRINFYTAYINMNTDYQLD